MSAALLLFFFFFFFLFFFFFFCLFVLFFKFLKKSESKVTFNAILYWFIYYTAPSCIIKRMKETGVGLRWTWVNPHLEQCFVDVNVISVKSKKS